MSTRMIRKQIYIQKRQDALLKRLSAARGLSEAEIIRRAIEREIAGEPPSADLSTSLSAIDDFARLALSQRARGKKHAPYRWDREELYTDREGRWLREGDEQGDPE